MITGVAFAFTFHTSCISIVRSLYLKIFSASFLITFLSPGFAVSIIIHVPFSLSRIIMSGFLLGLVLSACTCRFYSIVTLSLCVVTTDFGTCSYQCFLSSCAPISWHMWMCVCALYHAVLHLVLLPVLGMLILYGLLSHQVGKFCIYYLSLWVVFLWRSTLCFNVWSCAATISLSVSFR